MEDNKIMELVNLMKKGEQNAFEEMYRETYRSIYFICLGFMKNEENAKDAMQDTYLTAFSKLEQLKEGEKFVAWIKQIAVNRCKRLLEQNMPVVLEEENLENLKREENENFLPEEYINNKEKRKIVMDIMRKKLSDIQYQTVILYYFNSLEIEEIADVMECPPGTVKSRLSVARAKIKEGVLEYEKENKDKLYSFVGLPFLTCLLAAEANAMTAPDVWADISLTIKELTICEEKTKSRKEKQKIAGRKINAGSGVVKRKMIIGVVAAVLLIGAGVGLAVSDRKEDNDKTAVVQNNAEHSEMQGEKDLDNAEDASWNVVEDEKGMVSDAFCYQMRWLTRHDFSTGQLDNPPADLMLFGNSDLPLSLPVTKEAILSTGDYSEYYTEIISPGNDKSYWMEKYSFYLNVYNLDTFDKTMEECLNKGWYSISDSGVGNGKLDELLGYEAEDIEDYNGYESDEGYLNLAVSELGSPSYIGVGLIYEQIDDAINDMVQEGDFSGQGISVEQYLSSAAKEYSNEALELAWEFDDFVICVDYIDGIYAGNGEPYVEISNVNYYTRELWNIVSAAETYYYGENIKEALYPESFVMPDKIPFGDYGKMDDSSLVTSLTTDDIERVFLNDYGYTLWEESQTVNDYGQLSKEYIYRSDTEFYKVEMKYYADTKTVVFIKITHTIRDRDMKEADYEKLVEQASVFCANDTQKERLYTLFESEEELPSVTMSGCKYYLKYYDDSDEDGQKYVNAISINCEINQRESE